MMCTLHLQLYIWHTAIWLADEPTKCGCTEIPKGGRRRNRSSYYFTSVFSAPGIVQRETYILHRSLYNISIIVAVGACFCLPDLGVVITLPIHHRTNHV